MKLRRTVKRLEFTARARALQTSALLATVALSLWVAREKLMAQSIPQPVLKIATTNGNQLLLVISNAVASTNYEIYRAPILNDTNFPFEPYIIGSVGQSNFIAEIGIDAAGFFKATIGSDLDNDGFPDWLDANPTDPTIGILSITIDSPTNGMTIN